MPFFSSAGSRRGGGGGGFGHPILPSTTSPSVRTSRPRKLSRRRNPVKDLILSNNLVFAIAVSLFFFFFLAVILRYGIPNPLHLHPRANSLASTSRNRKTSGARKPIASGRNISGAVVDLTTKDLYDKIEFRDIDGGPWKQGWVVTYHGDEWDSEKLKVFVVPHSHNDPGWKLTVEEYYERQSKHILDTIIASLLKCTAGVVAVIGYLPLESVDVELNANFSAREDSRRKFIWEEISYLERWWRDSSDPDKGNFIQLVKSGQLEIVGGGWANSHFFAIIEQMMEGNMWLNNTIGVVPKNSWSIDPFGYSATMAYLLRRMGFQNMLIQRTHYELKKELALHQNLEYMWRQSWDAGETTDIFVHMMPFYSYDVPHTCGPEPAICCEFDFARMHSFVYGSCPWGQHPIETTPSNVQERALKLLDQYRKKSTLYRTNTLLVPLGDDFRYVSTEEAEAQFRNYQMLFDYINSNPSLNAEAKFGTLEDYFQTLREEAERINFTHPGEVGSGELEGFPSLSGDFFTYADRQHDYWSGYYVSRPFFKAVDRVLEQTLRASEMMIALVLGYCQRSQCLKLPISFSHKLTAARRNLALFQHHDGVTGTAKDHVVLDYGTRMHTSLQDLQIFMSKAVEVLLGIHRGRSDQNPAPPSQFEPEQVRSKYDVQPVHRLIDVPEGSVKPVVVFNPLEQTRNEVVMVIVSNPHVSVLHSNWSCVRSQVSPEVQHDSEHTFTGQHRLYWQASVPAMGLETYYVANGFVGCEKAEPAKLKIFTSSTSLGCPTPYTCSKLQGNIVEIKNHHTKLVFDIKTGLLQKAIHKDGSQTIVEEEIGIYSSSGSGAYLFKPVGDAQPIVREGGKLVLSEGPLVQECYSYPKTEWQKTPISQSTRIYSGEKSIQEFVIEKEYHVELIGWEFNDKEIIARYKTDVSNKRVFYSDLNGFQMSRRETYDKIPLQGNYYPMPSLAFLQDSNGHRFSVHTRQSLGVASLKNGWLEIMLDRRLLRDDERGLGQGVVDNRPMNVIFHILRESNVSASTSTSATVPLNPSILSHRVGAHLNYPLHIFVGKKTEEISTQLPPPRSFSPLAASLPCDLHIVSFKVPQPLKYSQLSTGASRFVVILQRRKWDSSYCRQGNDQQCSTLANGHVNLFHIFKDLAVLDVKPTSLNLLHEDTEMLGYTETIGDEAQEGHVLLSPMELLAYKLDLRPNQVNSMK
ncbi:Alpha-mannosidase 2x [Asimina triloba]